MGSFDEAKTKNWLTVYTLPSQAASIKYAISNNVFLHVYQFYFLSIHIWYYHETNINKLISMVKLKLRTRLIIVDIQITGRKNNILQKKDRTKILTNPVIAKSTSNYILAFLIKAFQSTTSLKTRNKYIFPVPSYAWKILLN